MSEITDKIEEIGKKMITATPQEKLALAKEWVHLNNMLLAGSDRRTTDSAGQNRTPAATGEFH